MALFSDGFDDASLDAGWTVVDNDGDATVTESGGVLSIALPANNAHDDSPVSAPTYVRVTQPLGSGACDVRVKVNTEPTGGSSRSGGGIWVQNTSSEEDWTVFGRRYVAFGGDLHWWVDVGLGGSLYPQAQGSYTPGFGWLRVTWTDTGGDANHFHFYGSADGESWTEFHDLFHTGGSFAVGVFAFNDDGGDGSGSPAWTEQFDLFVEAGDPLGGATQTATVAPAELVVEALAVSAAAGVVSVSVTPAELVLEAGEPSAVSTVTATVAPAVLFLDAPAGVAGAAVQIATVVPAVLVLAARPVSAAPGGVVVAVTPAVVTLEALLVADGTVVAFELRSGGVVLWWAAGGAVRVWSSGGAL